MKVGAGKEQGLDAQVSSSLRIMHAGVYVHERDWTVWWICNMQILDLSSAPSWDGPGYDRLFSTWEDEIAMILLMNLMRTIVFKGVSTLSARP